MIVLALTLLAIAVADLVRWSPEPVKPARAVLSGTVAVLVAYGVAEASGMTTGDALGLAAAILLAVGGWLLFDTRLAPDAPGWPLGWMVVIVTAALFGSGIADPVTGRVASWYADLPFGFTRSISVDVFLLATGATLFLLATANRIVRLVSWRSARLPRPTRRISPAGA